jgi:tRNA modification GTPase
MISNDNIIALATPSGTGAIAVIRISGKEAINIAASAFRAINNKDLHEQDSHTIHLGYIENNNQILDKVLVSIFKDPHSYTGENVVEISCHGSSYIQQQIIQLYLNKGCRMARAGEFTLRAFLHGKMDLSQAEAVADLIASDSEASHTIALQQMRGGFSDEIKTLKDELLNFASLIELELDFSEEDVEFADRAQFTELLSRISHVLKRLIDSFALGNVLKHGIPIAIVGEPNVGKSTLLNALLNEDRAIVSEIPGTTRDTIEDELNIEGIGFRFIDTAGIRETDDKVESIGIKKTFEKIEKAQLIIYILDSNEYVHALPDFDKEVKRITTTYKADKLLMVLNKTDLLTPNQQDQLTKLMKAHNIGSFQFLSAKTQDGLEELKKKLLQLVNTGALRNDETIVSNARHYDALVKAKEEIHKVQEGLQNELSGDLLAIDIKQALFHLGEITGDITTDDLLGNIFSNFCIGK